jgi:5-methyltetrahydrofolate--homocysteine methyltransferase
MHRITLLRQQRADSPSLCLSDFVEDRHGDDLPDWVGLFSVTVGSYPEDDEYGGLLAQSLADRLVEAASEHLHELVRTEIWGYESELGDPQKLLSGSYRGIRPAPGYPALPDHRLKALILDLLGGTTNTMIRLTETQAMEPSSSACGIYLAHEQSSYLHIGIIGKDQFTDYAQRVGLGEESMMKYLAVRVETGDEKGSE